MPKKPRNWQTGQVHHGPPTGTGECFRHGGVLTNKFCARCQKSFCDDCLEVVNGRLYCDVCRTNPIVEAPPSETRYVATKLRYRGGRYRWGYVPAEKPSPRQPSKHPGLASIFVGIIMMIVGSLVCISQPAEGGAGTLSALGWASFIFGFIIFSVGRKARKKSRS